MYQEIQDKDLAKILLSRQNKAFQPELYVKFQPKGCFLSRSFAHQYENIRDFEVRDDDVWVVSFMKAGTTWTQEMVWLLNQNLDYEGAKQNLGRRFPYFENDSYDSEKRLVGAEISEGADSIALNRIRDMRSPRYIKTHLPLNLLPKHIQLNAKRPKVIYVARNPKDVCVSLFHHRVLVEGYLATMDDLVEEFVADLTYFASYWTHVKEFWDRRNETNVHFITYEEMKKDLSKVVRDTTEFLGKNFTDLEFERLIKHLSFDSMKKNPAANHQQLTESLQSLHGVPKKTDFIRKGKTGSWKEELSAESIKKLDDWIEVQKIEGIWENL